VEAEGLVRFKTRTAEKGEESICIQNEKAKRKGFCGEHSTQNESRRGTTNAAAWWGKSEKLSMQNVA